MWLPEANTESFDSYFAPRPGFQPIVKLHGSSNWYDINDPSDTRRRRSVEDPKEDSRHRHSRASVPPPGSAPAARRHGCGIGALPRRGLFL
jgi:hypothetical protein